MIKLNQRLTKNQAAEQFGADVISDLMAEGCEFTNRCMQPHEDHLVEFMASIEVTAMIDGESQEVRVSAYYYQPKDALGDVEDLSDLIWSVNHFYADSI